MNDDFDRAIENTNICLNPRKLYSLHSHLPSLPRVFLGKILCIKDAKNPLELVIATLHIAVYTTHLVPYLKSPITYSCLLTSRLGHGIAIYSDECE